MARHLVLVLPTKDAHEGRLIVTFRVGRPATSFLEFIIYGVVLYASNDTRPRGVILSQDEPPHELPHDGQRVVGRCGSTECPLDLWGK